jgi:RNA polymerase-binding transcription factor DksA
MLTTIIPETLRPVAHLLTAYCKPLLQWASDYILNQLVEKNHNHPLVRIKTLLDFSELEQACADYHQLNSGSGRPIEHSAARLLRTLFLRYWFDASLRRTEDLLRFDMLARWFAGYRLHQAVPDHTTLHNFERYLDENHHDLFFNAVLSQIDAALDDGHDTVQLADTFALRACAALESLIQRLRHSSYQLLCAWQKHDPVAYAAVYAKLDGDALFGRKTEKREFFLAQEEWRERLRVAVQAIEELTAQLPDEKERSPEMNQRLAQLTKIIQDELAITRNADGCIQTIAYLSEKKRGHFRICSATDSAATIRNHGPGKKDFGYNISVAATPDFIRAIQADTGSTSDVVPIPNLLTVQAERGDALPEKLLYDQIAGNGKTAREVAQVSDNQTQLVAYPMPPKKSKTLPPEAFTLSADGHWLTCPNDRASSRRYRAGSGDGWSFRFIAAQCCGCPLLKQCRGSEETPKTHRSVFISDYRTDYDRLVAYSQTDEFKREMKLRPQIERIIAGLVLHCGARYARFRGTTKVDFQVKMNAMIYNVKHWLVRLDEIAGHRRRPTRRRWEAPTPSWTLPIG